MRIGIIGAGQLGQMLGYAARDLGHECFYLDPADHPPGASVGPVIQAAFDDRVALSILADKCDVLTYEFENVPVAALADIGYLAPVYPPTAALQQAQDRLAEKRLLHSLKIPLPDFCPIDSPGDLQRAVGSLGLPMVIKTRRLGYDGKGQFVLRSAEQLDAAWQELGGNALIAERWVNFDFEVSAIGVRNAQGEIATYCLTRNEHVDGILRVSRAPVVDAALTEQAATYMHTLLEHLDYVGALALEMFVVGQHLLANEFAPRVHNSGHWSIEGARTSQFANHIRAITGAALGSTDNLGHAGMINLIGEIPDAARKEADCSLHDYGKTPRPGRKLGHITVVADSAAARDQQIARISEIVTKSTSQPGTGT